MYDLKLFIIIKFQTPVEVEEDDKSEEVGVSAL